ncbi:MAG: hypothetical protein N2690_01615, partial [Rhodocyclaceae bacterium]|nr:hypothetical protein [Rhodocyclaceae bacterium]
MLYCLSFIVLILLAAPAAALDSVSLVAEQPVANEQGLVPARVLFTRTGSGYPLTVRYRISGVARSTLHGGSVAAVQVDSYGNNYITPLVTGQLIGGAAPASAAVITAYGGSGRIGSITVTEGGSDYYRVISEQGGVETREPLAPLVKIIGDGFGARATAQVSGSEQGYRVTHVIVESGGRGYSYATIVFEPQSGNGSAAVAVANIVGSPTIDVQVQSRGYGYPLPTISAVGDGTGAVLRPVIRDGRLYRVAIEQPGSGYTAPPVIVISGGSGHGASAVATINEAGQIAEVTVTNGGSGYGPTLHFDDPNTTAEFPVSARLLLADADYLAPPNTSIDPQTGDLIGTLTFSAAERTKVLTIAPRRNGVSGAVTAHVTLEPSETGSYIISYPMSVRISIADADDTARVAVTRPVAYPTPPTITPGVYPLEVQGRGELRVQVQQASHNRLRSIAVELSHDPGQGPLPGNEECWFAYSSKALDETATDYALVVPKKPAQPDPPPGPGSEEIAVDRLIFDINDIVIFHEPSAINNGIYRVVAVSGGKQDENPTIKISPQLRVIQTAYGVTRVRRIARFIASADLGSLRETTYTSYSDLYFYVFPVIDAHPPRARRSLMLQLLQTEDYRIVTPTTGSVILADDAVTARIRHVSNAVRPTVSGAVEVEFSRPFSKPVQVPFRILEAGTTAQIGRMNTQNPEDDVFILGLDPESKFGRLEIPAGATVGQIIVQPNPLNREAVLEQVTIQLMPSYDYLFGPLGTSPVNPTAVVTVAPLPMTELGRVVYLSIAQETVANEADESAQLRIYLSDVDGVELSDDAALHDIVVHYTLGGTASPGIDHQG